MILYAAVSLLNYFFCDRAIIDKTLFFEICKNFNNFPIAGKYGKSPEALKESGDPV
jgi:hypothetical protein